VARAPRRVSLKGKGADIFFGDYAPPGVGDEAPAVEAGAPAAPEPEAEAAPVDVTSSRPPSPGEADDASMLASKKESVQASMEERKKASKPARLQASKRAGRENRGDNSAGRSEGSPVVAVAGQEVDGPATIVAGGVSEEIWATLDQPATITNSFRYLESELDGMADILYEIGKAQGVKLTKQEVARLGLNVVLDDHRRRGAASLLSQLAARRHRRSGRH
jgi:hypothetical protein